MALGLGEMQLESFLNQPLRASVDLLNMDGLHEDEIRVRLATSEDFDKLGLDRAYFLTNITFEVVSDGRGGARILIRSEEPVLEPYLDFIVEARWPSGRLLREYTVLIDPPVFSQATPVVSASERVATTEGIPAPEPKKTESFSYNYDERRVNVGASDLPAGAMPQRAYNASTQSTPTPGSRYMISRDQTLWQIASMAKPAGATVHQTMLDIQRLNPDAFINGNINRIKAGYIIYLPTAEDISSADQPSALAEVREQNAAWRDGRDEAAYASSGPSLRISAEPEEAAPAEVEAQGAGSTGASQGGASAAGESALPVTADTASSDTLERLAALEQQLETLQRIVSLKDDQIAALQSALKDAGGAVTDVAPATVAAPAEIAEITPVTGDAAVAVDVEETAIEEPAVEAGADAEPVAAVAGAPGEDTEAKKPEPGPSPAAAKAPAAPDAATSDNWTSYLLYLLGALVLALAAFVVVRRRNAEAVEEELPLERPAPPVDDVFADVRLQDQTLEVEAAAEEPAAKSAEAPAAPDNRGYGERKHDEYASDVDAADALAEADIYIAYGRHPQAIDLLNNAIESEPGNPVYRLKLLEIYTELENEAAAMAQLQHIMETGDAESIARAEALIADLGGESSELEEPQFDPEPAPAPSAVDRGPGLPPNPLDIFSDSDETLEEVFSGLEIEDEHVPGEEDDDLDLSSDFAVDAPDVFDDEELVIAADSNALSTKLDLARAYLDMGDDDGARQILEEVVAEGSDELQAEAQALLDRID